MGMIQKAHTSLSGRREWLQRGTPRCRHSRRKAGQFRATVAPLAFLRARRDRPYQVMNCATLTRELLRDDTAAARRFAGVVSVPVIIPASERREIALAMARRQGSVNRRQLAVRCGVSRETARGDLRVLARLGLLRSSGEDPLRRM